MKEIVTVLLSQVLLLIIHVMLSLVGRHGNNVTYRTSNQNLTIRLTTDESKSGRGFKMNFTKYYTDTPFPGKISDWLINCY